ncbi:hypothetical protein [Streptomyces sp. NPDC051162]|uniref:hypothetical protein n=1 Tax=Streptomyces sp. NPDC051162 TaxID=3154747 RepID=UPI0034161B54
MSPTGITRRHALIAAAGVTATVSLASTGLLATPAVAAPQPLRDDDLKEALRRVEARRRRLLTSRPSASGWEMQKAADDGGDIVTRHVAGTGLNVSVPCVRATHVWRGSRPRSGPGTELRARGPGRYPT